MLRLSWQSGTLGGTIYFADDGTIGTWPNFHGVRHLSVEHCLALSPRTNTTPVKLDLKKIKFNLIKI